ncbi:MAG: hypothetical protein ACP5SH_09765 [Syntrophobacteraceae bacterium]
MKKNAILLAFAILTTGCIPVQNIGRMPLPPDQYATFYALPQPTCEPPPAPQIMPPQTLPLNRFPSWMENRPAQPLPLIHGGMTPEDSPAWVH